MEISSSEIKKPSKDPGSKGKKKKGHLREYTEALLIAVLIAFFLRAFVIEAFKIPSGSMIPSLVVGDHIFVNKFTYGIRFPFTKKWAAKFNSPERGEVIVFIYPEDEKLDFIKRVVGVPGDHVAVEGNDLFINGELVATAPIEVNGVSKKNKDQLDLVPIDNFPGGDPYKTIPLYPHWEDYTVYLEKLGDHPHLKQEARHSFPRQREWIIPEGMLFVMGDNRDNSRDSREWGFVPLENVKGKAMFIWLSLRHNAAGKITGIRWSRFGKWIS